jgi:hypothetical protein
MLLRFCVLVLAVVLVVGYDVMTRVTAVHLFEYDSPAGGSPRSANIFVIPVDHERSLGCVQMQGSPE